MQVIRVEGGLVKTFIETVTELCQRLASSLMEDWLSRPSLRLSASTGAAAILLEVGSETIHEIAAELPTACKLFSRKVGCEDHP